VIVKLLYTELNKDSPLHRFVDLGQYDVGSTGLIKHAICIGLICGWLGSLWIYLLCYVEKLKTKIELFKTRYRWVGFVGFAVATLTFGLPISYMGTKSLLANLWYERNLLSSSLGFSERTDLFFALLFISFLVRYIVTLLFATSPVPNGVFMPALVIGALLGRFYGEFLALDDSDIDPRVYSMIAAASLAGAITRTTSTILIIVELTENSRIILGLLVGVLVAYSTSNNFTMSIFDTVLTLKKLPYMPILFSSDIYKLRAKNICVSIDELILFKHTSVYELLLVLNSYEAINYDEYIPVLNNPESRKLVGAVRVVQCFEYLSKIGEKLIEEYTNSKYSTSIKMISGKLQNALKIDDVNKKIKGGPISKYCNF
jgi:Voltage gated chloride channel